MGGNGSHSSGSGTGRDFPPVFSWDWDGKRFIFVGVGRERFENSLPCHPLLPGSDTSQTQINPAPGNKQQKGRGHAAASEKRKRKLGMYIKIYSYESRFCLLTILMDSQVSKSLKQQFLILFLHPPALHLSLSLIQISSNKLFQLYLFSHSNEKHYKWTRVWLLCCIKALIRIKPYIKS